ncbi:hypothetical protein [Clostridium perfringens]|uniref:Tellurite resistance protein TerB n=1 Tax=Clostridium perfringens (strain 13 / Type A) TaxID=195102 RepID=Q8XKL7_CLOPE|nr:hypothetical protein [Clostridium perfringens]EJT6164424.1 hypothetical protein [Clostridium perfringens]EJT6655890.1 hypothetical protein [Clostridium perfringens]ELC8458744.1 hypothetical protein [Clostridium perfringens]MCC5420432.1 hypothetical protein [Clostridium perfringens]MCC5431765.1 hypothetical protein [Clostridium perfringens]
MFLKELNKEQGLAFINLVTEFALADENIKKEEEDLIRTYMKELDLEEEELGNLSYEESIKTIKNSSEKVKNIVYFELVRIGLVDEDYDIEEVDFLEKISKDLNISRAKKIQVANCFYNFSEKDGEAKLEEMAKDIIG